MGAFILEEVVGTISHTIVGQAEDKSISPTKCEY